MECLSTWMIFKCSFWVSALVVGSVEDANWPPDSYLFTTFVNTGKLLTFSKFLVLTMPTASSFAKVLSRLLNKNLREHLCNIYALGYVVERNLRGLTSKLVCFLGRNVVFCGFSNKVFFSSVWSKVRYFRQLIWYEIPIEDDHERTFQNNLRLLSFSPALDGKDKPSNTTIGITPAFFTELKHFWKISPHPGNYKMRHFQDQK